MPEFIVRQPDGDYCTFSTVVDDFIVYDADRDELWEHFREQAEVRARREFDAALERIEESAGGTSAGPGVDLASQIRVRDIRHGGADEPGLTPDDQQAQYMSWLAKWRDWTPGSPLPR